MARALSPLTRYRRSPSEAELERTVRDHVTHMGGRVWHCDDSRRQSMTDCPDLICLVPAMPAVGRPGLVALIEVKSQRRDVTDGQADVLRLLAGCTRLASGILRPEPRPGERSLDDWLAVLAGEETS